MGILAAIPIIGDLFKTAADVIDKAVPDADKRMELRNTLRMAEIEATSKIIEAEHNEKIAQVDVNKIEAASNDAYVRRARPTILWICGIAMGYNFLIHPLFCWGLTIATIWSPEVAKVTAPPVLSLTEMMPVLLGMLGLSGYRTYEKTKGVVGK